MADESNHPNIIIVKKKKHGEHGHHGGGWKVAYADFVTAMMAFFLLLWLLNVTTDEQKRGIAQYFTPDSVSRATSGSGAILGGMTLSPGDMAREAGGLVMSSPVTANAEDSDEEKEENEDRDETTPPPPGKDSKTPSADAKKPPSEKDIKEAIAQREDQEFKAAEHDLRQAIEDVPELRQLAQNLIIDRTPEGLRIQIVDQGRYAMFPLGSAAPYDHTKKLMALVSKIVERLPNKVALTGHTDSTPFANSTTYSNWELSTDRANASRRSLIEAGLPAQRINRVVGKSDQEPLFADNPSDPRNRRISIVLLREAPVVAKN